MGQGPLRIGVDQGDFAGPGPGRLDRQMAGQGGLARAAFLGCRNDGVHGGSMALPLFRAREGQKRNLS
jgi:hypothetical protein